MVHNAAPRPVFIRVNGHHINANTLDDIVFDDEEMSVEVTYDSGRTLRETFSQLKDYKRMKIKLGKLLRLGTMFIPDDPSDPDVAALGAAPQVDPDVAALGAAPQVDPDVAALGAAPQVDPVAPSDNTDE